MKIIVGLGNTGDQYSKNRHNVGFILVDRIVADKGSKWKENKKFGAMIAKKGNFVFVKPQTFMNNSGDAVSKAMHYYKVLPEDLMVVHDDVDLKFEAVKKQFGAGHAGHKGVQCIIDHLGSKDFWRVRVGVGRSGNPGISTEDWVLMDFSGDELEFVHGLGLDV